VKFSKSRSPPPGISGVRTVGLRQVSLGAPEPDIAVN
jgi:hypothetical protein